MKRLVRALVALAAVSAFLFEAAHLDAFDAFGERSEGHCRLCHTAGGGSPPRVEAPPPASRFESRTPELGETRRAKPLAFTPFSRAPPR